MDSVNEKEHYKIMFKFIEQAFIALLCFSGSLATKCISLNNEPCLTRSTFIDLNPTELHYYPFMVSLDRCNGSCNTIVDPSARICVLNKTENVNLNAFNMITRINESKKLLIHILCD